MVREWLNLVYNRHVKTGTVLSFPATYTDCTSHTLNSIISVVCLMNALHQLLHSWEPERHSWVVKGYLNQSFSRERSLTAGSLFQFSSRKGYSATGVAWGWRGSRLYPSLDTLLTVCEACELLSPNSAPVSKLLSSGSWMLLIQSLRTLWHFSVQH